jgi:hypothetical protein
MRTIPPWMKDESLAGTACALTGIGLDIACSHSCVASISIPRNSSWSRDRKHNAGALY